MGRPSKPEGTRASDVVATGVRLPPDLRTQLQREAFIHQRSLAAEILFRLRSSFEQPELAARLAAVRTLESGDDLRAGEPPPKGSPVPPLGDSQRLLLSYFNGLTPDKQLALLTLLAR